MLEFLETCDAPEPQVHSWVDWERNPHRVTSPTLPPPSSVESAPVTPPLPVAYVPIGHSKRNTNDRRCRCGSQQHLTSAHRLCPLNHRLWDAADEPNSDRLRLYVPRTLAREYHVGKTVQLFEGKVTAVTNDGLLTLTFDDGDVDNVDEKDLLHIFSDMRKLRAGKRRRVSSAPCNAKRTR